MTPPTRRVLLGGAVVLPVIKSSHRETPAPASDTGPDAALLADCAAFDDLEMAYQQSFNGELDHTPEWIKVEEERDRIQEAQAPLLDRICDQPATTLAGLQAKARSLVLWDEDAIDDDAEYINDRLRSSLLRDLVTVPVSPKRPGHNSRSASPAGRFQTVRLC